MAVLAAKEDTILKAPPFVIYSLISTYADADFIPATWDSAILPAILNHQIFRQVHNTGRNWLKLFENLCILNYTNLTHIKTILDKNYLDEYFRHHQLSSDFTNLLNIYQTVTWRRDNPLESVNCQKYLAMAFDILSASMEKTLNICYLIPVLGKEFVLQEISTKCGHTIPYIVIQKKETGEFVNVTAYQDPNEKGFIPLNTLTCNDDERM